MAFILMNAYMCGDHASMAAYFRNTEDAFGISAFAWPWNVAEAAWTIQAAKLCKSNPTCETQVESTSFIDQVVYTPGLAVSMTGMTSDLNFGVANIIYDE